MKATTPTKTPGKDMMSLVHNGRVCSMKGCGKPAYLDYFVCPEHFLTYANPDIRAAILQHAEESFRVQES